jgi:hypothetical protein
MGGRRSSGIARAVIVIGFLAAAPPVSVAAAPNVVVILADDLGFSDLGCQGGEIDTPNLDRPATRCPARPGARRPRVQDGRGCCRRYSNRPAIARTTRENGTWMASHSPRDSSGRST